MELASILNPLVGGTLIGVAVTIMLLFNGRVTGISGILYSSLSVPRKESHWRWMFLVGMISGGFLVSRFRPDFFANLSGHGILVVAAAGILVGYGSVMGSGCTSGHGVCGISRFSIRSIAATTTFMLFGFFAVQIVLAIAGGAS